MKHPRSVILALVILAGLVIAGVFDVNHLNRGIGDVNVNTPSKTDSKSQVVLAPSPCANNTLSQLIIVSLNDQHLWACSFSTTSYSSAVVTGYSGLAADITPTGNYQIFAKETDVNLTGSDGRSSWDDHVSYWMPFLDNQYGVYGFHDATWRTPSQFGNISPSSPNASHGCVEMPLAAAEWLYSWSSVGTQIQIEQSA